MNVQQLKSRALNLSGVDLEDGVLLELLNQGQDDFALRSQYPRKLVTLAETEPGTSFYQWPTDLLLPREITVGGSAPYSASSQESVRQYERGLANPVGDGLWFDAVGESGTRKLGLYPAPGSVAAIELEYVYRPPEFTGDDDEPSWMPRPFHKGLPYSTLAVYFETVEDNPELAQWNQEKADAVASELRSYDIERGDGNGVFQVPVIGWTAPR